MTKTLIAAALATLLTAPVMAEPVTNLVVNGSFEDTSDSAGEQTQGAGSWRVYGGLPGWAVDSGAGVEVRNNVAGTAFDRASFIELDSNNNSAISQLLLTVSGVWYDLSLAYSARPGVNGPANTNDVSLSWTGTTLDTLSGINTGSNHQWTIHTYRVLGTGQDTLKLWATGHSDSLGGSIDAVSLTAARPTESELTNQVPEPSSYALAGLALLASVFASRRRKA